MIRRILKWVLILVLILGLYFFSTGRWADKKDPVFRKQEVARLDNDEYVQAVAQATADLAVAEADLTGAQNARDIAQRELDRMETLKKRGVSSASQVDAAQADYRLFGQSAGSPENDPVHHRCRPGRVTDADPADWH